MVRNNVEILYHVLRKFRLIFHPLGTRMDYVYEVKTKIGRENGEFRLIIGSDEYADWGARETVYSLLLMNIY